MTVELIAEIGMHHEGKIDLCKKLCLDATKAGATAVKFQLYTPEEIAIKTSDDYVAFAKQKFFTPQEWKDIVWWCNQKGIKWGIAPFGVESAKQAIELCPDFIKIASSELTDIPMLRTLTYSKLRLIASLGSATEREIVTAKRECCITTHLHCILLYPAPLECIRSFKSEFDKIRQLNGTFGLSSHFILDPMLTPLTHAVTLGATTLEVHFTDDKRKQGQDHAWSMDMEDIQNFRQWESILHMPYKWDIDPTLHNKRRLAYKSIVAKTDIFMGEKFTENNIITKRPGYGMSASRWDEALKQTAPQNFKKDDFILW